MPASTSGGSTDSTSFPHRWAIDWSLFFDINGSLKNTGTKRVQPAYKIDTSLVNPLGFLPEFSRPAPGTPPLTVKQLQAEPLDPNLEPANLAERNLLRGMALGLPSGQAVACAMGLQPIDDDNLRVGKAVVGDWEANKKIAELDDAFEGNAPLWYYVLAEAQDQWHKRASGFGGKGDATPLRLGSVGGRLVAETLIGLVLGDGHSVSAAGAELAATGHPDDRRADRCRVTLTSRQGACFSPAD